LRASIAAAAAADNNNNTSEVPAATEYNAAASI
jgi:hypothetical protein